MCSSAGAGSFALLAVGLAFSVKIQLDSGVGFCVLNRICLFNERTGNDGTYGEGVAELTAEEVTNGIGLFGKVAIVTGSNTGIGKETARVLALRGVHVIMACRSLSRCDAARKAIRMELGAMDALHRLLETMELDLSDMSSVKSFADSFLAKNVSLHFLIHNAAVLPATYQTSAQGIELGFGVNSLSVFYLTQRLLPKLKSSAPSRVIDVSSATISMIDRYRWLSTQLPLSEDTFYKQGFLPLPSPFDFSTIGAYSLSKVSSTLLMAEFRRKFRGSGVEFAAVHPGLIPTELTRHSDAVSFLFHVVPGYTDMLGITRAHKTIAQGASTTVWALVNDISQDLYYADNAPHDNCSLKVYMGVISDEKFGGDVWRLHESLLNNLSFGV